MRPPIVEETFGGFSCVPSMFEAGLKEAWSKTHESMYKKRVRGMAAKQSQLCCDTVLDELACDNEVYIHQGYWL